MIFKTEVTGYFEENCYFFIEDTTKHGFLIDPGAQAQFLLDCIQENEWHIEKILLTHGHFDHIGAVETIRSALDIAVYAHKTADDYLLNGQKNLSALYGTPITVKGAKRLNDKDTIALDANKDFVLNVIYTPGHSTDSVTYYAPKENIAFVGDTIFKGTIGYHQYPGGNRIDLHKSVHEKIFTLPEETILYSGHSDPTTVGREKSGNLLSD